MYDKEALKDRANCIEIAKHLGIPQSSNGRYIAGRDQRQRPDRREALVGPQGGQGRGRIRVGLRYEPDALHGVLSNHR